MITNIQTLMPVPLSSSAFVGSMDYTLLVSPEDCGEEIFF